LRTVEHKRAILGFSVERDATGVWTVRSVDDGSSSAAAGLRPGDSIVSWNDGELPRSLARWVRERQPGETVRVRVRHEDRERTFEFKLGEEKEMLYQVVEDFIAGDKARRIREGLLRGTTQPAVTQ
jgi:predicted metalloprotease with PDZ domain